MGAIHKEGAKDQDRKNKVQNRLAAIYESQRKKECYFIHEGGWDKEDGRMKMEEMLKGKVWTRPKTKEMEWVKQRRRAAAHTDGTASSVARWPPPSRGGLVAGGRLGG